MKPELFPVRLDGLRTQEGASLGYTAYVETARAREAVNALRQAADDLEKRADVHELDEAQRYDLISIFGPEQHAPKWYLRPMVEALAPLRCKLCDRRTIGPICAHCLAVDDHERRERMEERKWRA